MRNYLTRLLVIAALALFLAPAQALAYQFTMSGDNAIKIQSEGNLDPYWVPITNSDPNDPALFGLPESIVSRINLFDATGVASFADGDTFDNLTYTAPGDLVVADGGVKWNRPSRNESGYDVLFAGRVHLTTLSIFQDRISIRGYLDNLYVNPLTTSKVLLSFLNDASAAFVMDIFSSSKTERGFVDTLNSRGNSTWAGVSATVAATPEPGTMILFASALGVWGYSRRKKPQVS
jgi:hypothetical protein